MKRRFQDDGRTIYAFGHSFLVRCPRCDKRASVLPVAADQIGLFDDRKLTCLQCGVNRRWEKQIDKRTLDRMDLWRGTARFGRNIRMKSTHPKYRGIGIGNSATDWYFNLPLWLQTPCCGHTLWAYNADHLAFLEAFVSADLREVSTHRNQALASRLPRWMIGAHQRAAVLQGLARLRARLAEWE